MRRFHIFSTSTLFSRAKILTFSFMNFFPINREIDKKEFKKVMAMMRAHNRQGAHHRDGLRAGLKVGGSVENGGLVEYFFGEDGKKCLQLNKFIQFLGDLHNEVCEANYPHHYTRKVCASFYVI